MQDLQMMMMMDLLPLMLQFLETLDLPPPQVRKSGVELFPHDANPRPQISWPPVAQMS